MKKEEKNNDDLCNEVKAYLNELRFKKKFKYRYNFKKFKPELFNFIFKYTKFMDSNTPTFRGRLTTVLHKLQQYPKCQLLGCNNSLNINDWKPFDPLPKHCCYKHAALNDKTKQLRSETCLKTYGVNSLFKLDYVKQQNQQNLQKHHDEIIAKRKKTLLEKYGDENYVNVEKMKKTLLEKYGSENYINIEKILQTYNNKSDKEKAEIHQKIKNTKHKHSLEDPNFLKNIQEKSIATRKKNNGEDYTGRAKCKKTMLKRYGYENAFQLESVKQKSKETLINHYGVEHALQNSELIKQAVKNHQNTCLEKYGTTSYQSSEQCKKASLEKYGVEHTFQVDEIKQKIKQTCLERYGYENPMQNDDIRKKSKTKYMMVCLQKYGTTSYFSSDQYKKYCLEKYGCENPMQNSYVRHKQQQKYTFKEISFDSAPEIAFFIWLTDNKIPFEYQPNITFEYEYKGKKHVYMPDFLVENQLIELKGNQFLNENGTWKNPFDRSQDDFYEAKHQCLLKNNVKILYEDDYRKYIKYAEKKYGKNYLKQFKNDDKEEKDTNNKKRV